MNRDYLTIIAVQNGWVVTKNGDLFQAAIYGSVRPIWVFNQHRAMCRFINQEGFRIRKVSATESVAEPKK